MKKFQHFFFTHISLKQIKSQKLVLFPFYEKIPENSKKNTSKKKVALSCLRESLCNNKSNVCGVNGMS